MTSQTAPQRLRSPFRWVRTLLRWAARIAFGIIALLVVAGLAGAIWQAIAARADASRFPPPGDLVDVGGRKLHMDCQGAGTPVVVIEAGAQDWSTGWIRPQRELARHTRTCTYDRAGLGWSDASADPKDGVHIADDLQRLLDAAGVHRPVVLVGHSLGGTANRVFYQRYPEDVAGLVFLEPGNPDQLREMFPDAGGQPAFGGWAETVASVATRIGIIRWFYRDLFAGRGFPDEEVDAARARMALPAATSALTSTIRHLPVTADQVDGRAAFGDLPVVVVYSSNFDEYGTAFDDESERQQFRRETVAQWTSLAELSSISRPPVVIQDANHLTMIRDDRYWPQTVDSILSVVSEVRSQTAGRDFRGQ